MKNEDAIRCIQISVDTRFDRFEQWLIQLRKDLLDEDTVVMSRYQLNKEKKELDDKAEQIYEEGRKQGFEDGRKSGFKQALEQFGAYTPTGMTLSSFSDSCIIKDAIFPAEGK